ncbi:MAG: hypothetical protein COU08_03265 [Candidatus Harrisonbacteria bacterium CG10_big_fil_rev_8_21_14_0_10_42_17]|uniref:POTRA domain-containing protein n=1 Tax=Candidatus Harrisonbacteria bacterium CG10_big_fil_rev_8_21_14_0_10_42_17 TaxID=1974584 RepID=A0A2M6WHU6_9BACT|nr:MAG: hypothetical protein COU08_03265 [Candidatus Harrisonbacteria bacterium CG10_big_fil_rev_8_21_14_0_10_42_17]
MRDIVLPPKRKKRHRWFYVKVYGSIMLATLVLFFVGYFLKASQYFTLNEIRILGVPEGEEVSFLADVQDSLSRRGIRALFSLDNYFRWPGKLSFEDPKFMRISVEKYFFARALTITAEPRKRYALWCFEDTKFRCYWFDEMQGLLLEEAPYSEGQLIARIIDTTKQSYTIGDTVLPNEQFDNIVTILNHLMPLHIPFREMTLDRVTQEMMVTTVSGAVFLFSFRHETDASAFSSLETLLREHSLREIEYADFTVPSKVYLKRR